MTSLIVLIGVFLLLIVGSLLLAMVVFKQAKAGITGTPQNSTPPAKFNIKYVLLSLVVLLLTAVMLVWLGPRLPASVGYNIDATGTPSATMPATHLMIWTVLPQMLLTLLALIVGWGVTKLGAILRPPEGGVSMPGLMLVMGNIIGLPQLIILYAMTNIYIFNIYDTQLPPFWIFTVVVMGIAGVILGAFFINMIRKMGGITLTDK